MATVRALVKRTVFKVFPNIRQYSSDCKRGLVLGAFTDEKDKFLLTPEAESFNIEAKGVLVDQLNVSGLKKGKARLFYKPTADVDVVAVVGLGKKDEPFDQLNDIDRKKENIRVAAGEGVKSLQTVDVTHIQVGNLCDPTAAAEGAVLAAFKFQKFKQEQKRTKLPQISQYSSQDSEQWAEGVVLGEAQNTARYLKELPSNHLTPTIFGQIVEKELSDGVKVVVHDKKWAEAMKMGSFLSVSQGSREEPKFLEMTYSCGGDLPKIVLVGKGVTFDTGGISIKPSAAMDRMRGDMGGAALVVATMKAISQLKLRLNVVGLCPLTENMPGGSAVKPGDVVTASNGKTIAVDNTDAEGRLILADALVYAADFSPCFTMDVATLTGAIKVALGTAVTGCFTNSTDRFNQIQKAGTLTGDRIWRMPLYEVFSQRMTDFPAYDLNNVGKPGGGGSCTAAAFLKEFAPPGDWMHLDIAGVCDVDPHHGMPYLGGSGMSGRPTRTVVEFLKNFQT